jgi:putative hydrolase of the HAD superfamily
MFPFDVILFDVGGVLLTNGWDHSERAETARQFELDLAGLEVRHAEVYPAWERGAITGKEYLTHVVFNEPRSFSRGAFFSFMLSQSKLLPDGALGILEEVAALKKCMVGALNNEARETNEYRFREFGLREHLSVSLSSCYLGLRKPDPAIYHRALDILGRPAERILFIDDRAENAAAAAGVGMKAIQFKGAESLRVELVSLGVFEGTREQGPGTRQ